MPSEPLPGFDRRETNAPLCAARAHSESVTMLEFLEELREILQNLDASGRQDEAVENSPTIFAPGSPGAGEPGENESPSDERDQTRTLFIPPVDAPDMPTGGAAALLDPAPATGRESLPWRRNGMAFSILAIASLVVLGATSFVMTRGPGLSHLTASAPGKRSSHAGDSPETTARAALPPLVIPAVVRNDAAVARPLPIAGSIPSAAIGRAAPVRALGGNIASARTSDPRNTSRVPLSPPAAPTRTAPSVAMPSPADRAVGKQLREAGDARIVEGDVASARLFYERAAADGDAQAALDLGNSFNPAFLERLGVLGMRGDVVAAASWYRRAHALGDPDATKALQNLAH